MPLIPCHCVFWLYTMAIVLFSSWLRRRFSYRFWRNLHYISFVAFALVTAHGLLAGSDSDEPWMRGVYGFATGAIAFLVLARMLVGVSESSAQAYK